MWHFSSGKTGKIKSHINRQVYRNSISYCLAVRNYSSPSSFGLLSATITRNFLPCLCASHSTRFINEELKSDKSSISSDKKGEKRSILGQLFILSHGFICGYLLEPAHEDDLTNTYSSLKEE